MGRQGDKFAHLILLVSQSPCLPVFFSCRSARGTYREKSSSRLRFLSFKLEEQLAKLSWGVPVRNRSYPIQVNYEPTIFP